nr:hypothetical protein [Kibdelosporangium sp. MJ126-NF4]
MMLTSRATHHIASCNSPMIAMIAGTDQIAHSTVVEPRSDVFMT